MKIINLGLLILCLLLLSCTSLEEIHKDKIDFVISLMGNSDSCLMKIKKSPYYKIGFTSIGSESCCGLQGRTNNYGKENLKIELNIPNVDSLKDKVVYIIVIDPKDTHRIGFEFEKINDKEYILKGTSTIIIRDYPL